MKLTLLCLLALASAFAPSDDDPIKKGNPLVERRVHATYTEEITFLNRRREVATVRTFATDGHRITEEHYANYEQGIKHGLTRCWYPNGQTYWSSDFKHGDMHGPLLVYYADGATKRREYFKRGLSRESKCFDATGQAIPCESFAKPASFPGLEKEFLKELGAKLAESGYKTRNESQYLTYQVVVEEDGTLGLINVYPTDHELATPLRKALGQLINWKPATVDNAPVAAHFGQTLIFHGKDVYVSR